MNDFLMLILTAGPSVTSFLTRNHRFNAKLILLVGALIRLGWNEKVQCVNRVASLRTKRLVNEGNGIMAEKDGKRSWFITGRVIFACGRQTVRRPHF
jgi:hypothetical protein